MKKHLIGILFLFILIFTISCSSDKYVLAVQQGKYFDSDVTNKFMLETVFKSCNWKSYKNKDDSIIMVSFTGSCIYELKIVNIEIVYSFKEDMTFTPIHYYVDGVDDILEFVRIVAKIYVGLE